MVLEANRELSEKEQEATRREDLVVAWDAPIWKNTYYLTAASFIAKARSIPCGGIRLTERLQPRQAGARRRCWNARRRFPEQPPPAFTNVSCGAFVRLGPRREGRNCLSLSVPAANSSFKLVSCPRNSRYIVAIKMGRRQGARTLRLKERLRSPIVLVLGEKGRDPPLLV